MSLQDGKAGAGETRSGAGGQAHLIGESPIAQPLRCAAGVGAVLLAAAYVFWLMRTKLDHDVSYFLSAGRILNDGARLYTDFIDFNIPAMLLAGRLSAWLAATIGAPLDITHKVVLLSVAAASLSLLFASVWPWLTRMPALRAWAFGFGVVLVLFANPDFGRREYLMIMMLAPWAFSVVLATEGLRPARSVSILSGAIAGIALLLKPHFVLFAVAIGGLDAVRAGLRPRLATIETWTAASVSVALYGAFLASYPTYLTEIVPFSLETYGRYQRETTAVLLDLLWPGAAVKATALAFGTVLIFASLRVTRLAVWAATMTLALAIAAIASGAIQGLAFHYQHLPFAAVILTACVLLLCLVLGEVLHGRTARTALAGAAIVLLLFGGSIARNIQNVVGYPDRASVLSDPLTVALRPDRAGQPLLIVSPSVVPAAQILPFLDVTWSGAMIPHFAIPALIVQGGLSGIEDPPPPEVQQALEHWMRERILRSFLARPPERVAVDVSPHLRFFSRPGFDILAWLRKDPAFDAAWRKAKLVAVGDPVAYGDGARLLQIYERRSPDA